MHVIARLVGSVRSMDMVVSTLLHRLDKWTDGHADLRHLLDLRICKRLPVQ